MLVAWQRLPYLDPGLPLELLPARWNGITAGHVFAEINDHLRWPASRCGIGHLRLTRPVPRRETLCMCEPEVVSDIVPGMVRGSAQGERHPLQAESDGERVVIVGTGEIESAFRNFATILRTRSSPLARKRHSLRRTPSAACLWCPLRNSRRCIRRTITGRSSRSR